MKHYHKLSIENAPRTIVLANGAFPTSPLALGLIDAWARGEGGFQLICCDGAINKLQKYSKVLPDAVVGDLDSIDSKLKADLGKRLKQFPDQETNDLTKTMNFVSKELDKSSVILLGASGERDDHFLANIALLPTYASLVDELIMLTDEGAFYLVQGESSFDVELAQQISVFNFAQSPLTLRGVHWALDRAVLPELWCGTLNRADEELISIDCPNPCLLYLANECKA